MSRLFVEKFCQIVSLTVCVFFFSFPISAEEEKSSPARMTIRISPEQIYEGDSARLIISVTNVPNDTEPDISYLEQDFQIQTLGSSRNSSVKIVSNGLKQTRIEDQTIEYNYQLTPKKTGTLSIVPPQMEVEGKRLEANTLTLQVKELTQTDIVLLEASIEPQKKIYPLVPFEISIDVLVKEFPEKYSQEDPLKLIVANVGIPKLTLPWLNSTTVNDITVADKDLENWLTDLKSQYGFSVNDYRMSTDPFDFGFSFFERPQSACFLPKGEEVERINSSGEKVRYIKYSFKRKLRATKSTTLSFGTSSLRGNFIDFKDEEKPSSIFVSLATPPLEINIESIPQDAAPSDYVGIYGKVKTTAEISSKTASIGDALTFSLAIQGFGSFQDAVSPDIEKDFPQGTFKIYPPTTRSLDNGVAFDYKIRPTKDGKVSIPSISVSYFDIDKEDFVNIQTQPIEIDVKKSLLKSGVSEEDTLQKDIQEKKGETTLTKQTETQTKWMLFILSVIGIIVFCIVIIWLLRIFLKYNAERIANSNQYIIESARRRLEEALLLDETNLPTIFAEVRASFLQLITKRFSTSIEVVTDAETIELFDKEIETFRKSNKNDADVSKYVEILCKMKEMFHQAEQIKFGGAILTKNNFKEDVRNLFEDWLIFLKSQTNNLSTLAYAASHKKL